jgi:hypothetical protein
LPKFGGDVRLLRRLRPNTPDAPRPMRGREP